MLHVGLDVHKHFSQVAVTGDGGELIDSRRLHHVDKSSITDYFSRLPTPVTITMESTRNWYWLYELLEEYGEVKLANARVEPVNDFETLAMRIYCTAFSEKPPLMRAVRLMLGGYSGSSAAEIVGPGASWRTAFSNGGLIQTIAGNSGGDGGRFTNLSGCKA